MTVGDAVWAWSPIEVYWAMQAQRLEMEDRAIYFAAANNGMLGPKKD